VSLTTTINWRPKSEPVPDEPDGFYITYLLVRGSGLIGTAHDKGARPVIQNYTYYRERKGDHLVPVPFPDWVSEYALNVDIITEENP
jgi:hypothetical protein